jgi:hypothetical protein
MGTPAMAWRLMTAALESLSGHSLTEELSGHSLAGLLLYAVSAALELAAGCPLV